MGCIPMNPGICLPGLPGRAMKAVPPGLVLSRRRGTAAGLEGDASQQGLSHLLPNAYLMALSEQPLCLCRLWSSLCLLGPPDRCPRGLCDLSPHPGGG